MLAVAGERHSLERGPAPGRRVERALRRLQFGASPALRGLLLFGPWFHGQEATVPARARVQGILPGVSLQVLGTRWRWTRPPGGGSRGRWGIRRRGSVQAPQGGGRAGPLARGPLYGAASEPRPQPRAGREPPSTVREPGRWPGSWLRPDVPTAVSSRCPRMASDGRAGVTPRPRAPRSSPRSGASRNKPIEA